MLKRQDNSTWATPHSWIYILAPLLCITVSGLTAAETWPQAAGPNNNWTVTTNKPVPVRWSVEQNQQIKWKADLPETGQSGIAVWGDYIFLTTMKPLAADAKRKSGSDIIIYALSAEDGKILWQHELAGDPQASSPYAYGFSDSSSPTPITDGQHVWFWNASGRMGCWTMSGEKVWERGWTPTLKRPFNKQYEPIKIGNILFNVEPLPIDDPKREADAWNYLRAFDATTGADVWTAPGGLTHYNTPVVGVAENGHHAILYGRGAHHGTPEAPAGLTLTYVDGPQAGQAAWSWSSAKDGKAMATQCWDKKYAYWIDETLTELVVLHTTDGSEAKRISWITNVDVTTYDEKNKTFTHKKAINLKEENPNLTVFPAWYANVSMYPYVYFQCFSFTGKQGGKGKLIGPAHSFVRINVETDKVEYVEIPFPTPEVPDQVNINGEFHYPKMALNSRGIDVVSDKRSRRDGWWWCFNGNTIAINNYLYFTFMCGRVQVLDGKAEVFDERALIALNDLGPFGETWSVNTPSYCNGRLYHRTMKSLYCIETTK